MTPNPPASRCTEGAVHTQRLDAIEEDVAKIQATLQGNGTGGVIMRVSNVENDIKHVIAGLNKVQGTMSMISRTAWSIITCIGLAALFWAARELVTR